MDQAKHIMALSASNATLTDMEVLSLADILLEQLGHEDDGLPYRKLNDVHAEDVRPQIMALINSLAESSGLRVKFLG